MSGDHATAHLATAMETLAAQLQTRARLIGLSPEEQETAWKQFTDRVELFVSDFSRMQQSEVTKMTHACEEQLEQVRQMVQRLQEPLQSELLQRLAAVADRAQHPLHLHSTDVGGASPSSSIRASSSVSMTPLLLGEDRCVEVAEVIGDMPLRSLLNILTTESTHLDSICQRRVMQLSVLSRIRHWLSACSFEEQYENRIACATLLGSNQELGEDPTDMVLRLGRRQDLSLQRLQQEANALLASLEALNDGMRANIQDERRLIAELHDQLSQDSSVPTVTVSKGSMTAKSVDAALEEYDRNHGLDKELHDILRESASAAMWSDEIVKVLSFRSLWPALQQTTAEREELQRRLHAHHQLLLQDAVESLIRSHKRYGELSGDTKYAVPPTVADLIGDAPSSTDSLFSADGNTLLLQRIAQVKSAVRTVQREQNLVDEKIVFLELLEPLMQRRDEIVRRKQDMEISSRERLLNKRGNMAKILLEEEKVRLLFSRELPKVQHQLQQRAVEWSTRFPHCELMLRGEVVATTSPSEHSVLSAHNHSVVSTVSSGRRTPLGSVSRQNSAQRAPPATCGSSSSSTTSVSSMFKRPRSLSPVPLSPPPKTRIGPAGRENHL